MRPNSNRQVVLATIVRASAHIHSAFVVDNDFAARAPGMVTEDVRKANSLGMRLDRRKNATVSLFQWHRRLK